MITFIITFFSKNLVQSNTIQIKVKEVGDAIDVAELLCSGRSYSVVEA